MSVIEYQNQNVEQDEFQHSSIEDDNNTIFVSSSHLSESSMEDPYMFEGEDCINQDFCYYYYSNQLTPEEAMLGVAFNNNNELYINDPVNSVITWSSELELQNHVNDFPYLYDDIIENDNFDSYNPFVGQSSIYGDSDSIPTSGGNLLLTQPLSEVTQNVIENQQFHPYNWCDLSSFPDAQQFFIENNNISSKIAEQNQQNHNIPTENCYTPWTDFQLLEA